MDQEQMMSQLRSQLEQSSSLIQKLRTEEQQLTLQLSTAIYESQQQRQRPSVGGQSPAGILNTSKDQAKLESQLQKQLQNSESKLKQLQHELKQQGRKKPKDELDSVNELFQIDCQFKQTETDIKSVNQEIKNLNLLKKTQQKALINRESTLNTESSKVSKMIDELYLLRSTLDKLKQLSEKKKHDIQVKKQEVKEIEGRYLAICSRNGDKPVTFEEFKLMMADKLRSGSHVEKSAKKQYVSIKQLIKSKETYQHIQPTKQNLLELRNKKEIAHHALRNAKKKHEVELRELSRRLSEIKEENCQLQSRLSEKEKERKEAGNSYNKRGRFTPMG